MTISTATRRAALLLLLLLTAACARRQPNLAQLSADELYARATTAYEAQDYGRAVQLLEAFVQAHLGDPRAEEARLRLGQAQLERDQYLQAATHFQRLVTDYPNSPLQLQARYGICQAYHELSPRPALDQEYTYSALLHCESIPQYYPGTEQAEAAAALAAGMRQKLAQKAYDAGVFYFKRNAYDAAVVYFEDVVRQFPGTSLAPAALGQLAETYRLLGYVEEAEEARQRLLRDYPESPEAQALRA